MRNSVKVPHVICDFYLNDIIKLHFYWKLLTNIVYHLTNV